MILATSRRAPVPLMCGLIYVASAMAHPASGQPAVAPDCQLEAGPTRAVARVLDGETVRLDDGSEVRLIGALAPRAFDVGASHGTWPPEQAAIQVLTNLVQGRSVTLWFSGRRIDRYGRWLAHMTVADNGMHEWMQGTMPEQGMARAYVLPGNAACHGALLARERPAREAHRGLWANAAYYVRAADQPKDLVSLRHTFQLVRGIVQRTARARGRIYLNFGARSRRGFSVRLSANADILPHGADPTALRGRLLLVRGWVNRRAGPLIDVDAPGQIELVDDARVQPLLRQEKAPGEQAAGRQ